MYRLDSKRKPTALINEPQKSDPTSRRGNLEEWFEFQKQRMQANNTKPPSLPKSHRYLRPKDKLLIARLRDEGVEWTTIARVFSIGRTTVWRVLYGDNRREK